MAIQSRISRILLDSGTGNTRQWVATANVQDVAAGGQITVEVVHSTTGIPPGVPDGTSELLLVRSDGTSIRSQTVPTATGTNNFDFWLTDDGLATGNPLSGTFELLLDMQRTTIVTYSVESDGSPSTPPSGYSAVLDRGWVRGTTSANITASDLTPAYADVTTLTVALGAPLCVAQAVTLVLGPSSGLSNVVTGGHQRSITCDNTFPAAATLYSPTMSIAAPAGLATGQPATTFTVVDQDVTVDPRLTITHHLQVNDNVYDVLLDTNQRLTSDLGFATFKVTDADGVAVSGVTCTHRLRDNASLVAAVFDVSEATGATGRPASMQVWDSALPGGAWTHTVIVTAPAGATGLDSPQTEGWTLLAINPNLVVIPGAGPKVIADDGDHWHPGEDLLIGLAVYDVQTRTTVAVDVDGATPQAFVVIGRFNSTLGRAEYLAADHQTWTAITGGVAYEHQLAVSPGDADAYILTVAAANTATWNNADLFVIGVAYVDSTPYSLQNLVDVLSPTANGHDAYAFDGAGFVGFPSR